MRQIEYNNAAFLIYFAYPVEWDISSITGVNLIIQDLGGDELLSSQSATLYTATTLDAASSIGADYLSLTTGASAPVTGRQYWVAGSDAGPPELLVCDYYDSANENVYFRRNPEKAHSSGTAFRGAGCTYSLDTSSTGTWEKALQCLLIWTPVGSDDLSVAERAEVSHINLNISDLENSFLALYPREYNVITKRDVTFSTYSQEAYKHLSAALSARGLQMNRVMDQEAISPLMVSYIRYLVTLAGGDKWELEYERALNEYIRQFDIFAGNPMWLDQDQDTIQDVEEIDDYSARQVLNSERNIL